METEQHAQRGSPFRLVLRKWVLASVAHDTSALAPTQQQRKSSKDKNRDVELTALPSGQRVINVNSANRPILFADEAADLIKIIQERRASAVAANAPPASSPAVPVKV